ncbi:hypothetical protein ACHAXT_009411 [Thalassiosira profunda]
MRGADRDTCAFCREELRTGEEGDFMQLFRRRMENGDGAAYICMAALLLEREDSVLKRGENVSDVRECALQLNLRAGELGCCHGYHNAAIAYLHGLGVEADAEKAHQYMVLAAVGGNVRARCCLGSREATAGNMEWAMQHFQIAVRFGSEDALNEIKKLHIAGSATKEDYGTALRAFQKIQSEMKSVNRELAQKLEGYDTKKDRLLAFQKRREDTYEELCRENLEER